MLILFENVPVLQSPSCRDVLAATDFAVFIFDSTSLASFRTGHQLMLAVAQAAGDALPCVFLAAKDDLGMSQVGFSTARNAQCPATRCISLQISKYSRR